MQLFEQHQGPHCIPVFPGCHAYRHHAVLSEDKSRVLNPCIYLVTKPRQAKWNWTTILEAACYQDSGLTPHLGSGCLETYRNDTPRNLCRFSASRIAPFLGYLKDDSTLTFFSLSIAIPNVGWDRLILSKSFMCGELPLTAITLSCAIDNLGRLPSLDHT